LYSFFSFSFLYCFFLSFWSLSSSFLYLTSGTWDSIKAILFNISSSGEYITYLYRNLGSVYCYGKFKYVFFLFVERLLTSFCFRAFLSNLTSFPSISYFTLWTSPSVTILLLSGLKGSSAYLFSFLSLEVIDFLNFLDSLIS